MRGAKAIPAALTHDCLPRGRWNKPFNDTYINYSREGLPIHNYQDGKKRLGISAQYSFSMRYAMYLSIVEMTGFVQDLRRYAPDTPDCAKSSRLQELGYFTTIDVRGTF